MKCPACGVVNLPGADACENCGSSLTREDVPQAATEAIRSLMEDPVECLQPIRPLTVGAETSLQDAILLMRNHGIGCVLVTDDDGRLIGILTERDLLKKVAGRELDAGQCRVGDFMTRAPESCKPDHPLAYGLQRMIISDVRYLPVVDAGNRPAGIVSSRDFISYMAEKFNAVP
jgi:CBS domain-containing protein